MEVAPMATGGSAIAQATLRSKHLTTPLRACQIAELTIGQKALNYQDCDQADLESMERRRCR
eukprot:14504705-Alexandrium_andersonii.AAC.1